MNIICKKYDFIDEYISKNNFNWMDNEKITSIVPIDCVSFILQKLYYITKTVYFFSNYDTLFSTLNTIKIII